MTDISTLDHKALRELAAEALGYEWRWYNPRGGGLVLQVCINKALDDWRDFNPEYSDSDCAEVEAALLLNIEWKIHSCFSVNYLLRAKGMVFYDDHGGDKRAARRKASTVAAASWALIKRGAI